jgi:integrase
VTGTLRQRSADSWELRVSTGRDPVSGRYKQVTKTVRGNKTQARKALAELANEVHRGRHVGTDATLGTLLERWLEQVEGELSPTTVEGYRSNIAVHIMPALGHVPLRKLEPATLDAFYAALRRGGTRPALKASTVRQVHAVIRRACRQGVVWKWLPSNPAALASPGGVDRPDHAPPMPADVLRLIDTAGEGNADLACLLRLAAATGARRGELCALRWRHVDLDGAEVRIERAIIETGPGKQIITEKTTKTKQQRRVSLDPDTVAVLRIHRATWEDRMAKVDKPLLPACYVFAKEPPASAPLRPSSVTQSVRRLRDRLGLVGLRTHDLRHFSATQLLAQGVPIKTVSARLGHTLASTTMDIYAHALPAADKDAAVSMGTTLARPVTAVPDEEETT